MKHPSEVAPTSDRKQQLLFAGIALAAALVTYSPVLHRMGKAWFRSDDYAHGMLIAPLALFFAWERRRQLRSAELGGSWLGLGVLLLALFGFALGSLGGESMTMRLSFIVTVAGIVLLMLGPAVLKILAFPLAFSLFMVPLPQALINVIAFPLQLIAAKWAVAALHPFGIPALVEGNIISLPREQLFVADACSGLRSLMALITLGVVFAYFFRKRRPWVQLILVASTIPIAMVVNAFRVALTALLTYRWGLQAATGAIHELQGFMTFAIALILLFAEAKLIDVAIAAFRRRSAPREA